ncbi:MAG: hypothetical protein IJ733_10505, partial [Lachnospiraceae bacterium]|nr:hypothetical protein [Lachnospiraceae bacterium]
VTNEKKATFVYKVSEVHHMSRKGKDADGNETWEDYDETVERDYSKAKDGSGGFKIFTPEY